MSILSRHVDHSGGLKEVVARAVQGGSKTVVVDVHSDRPNARGFMLELGNIPMNAVSLLV